jgi:CheY-like chemotaxis protein
MLDPLEIAAMLPGLRRFSRTLSGSYSRGDEQINKLIETPISVESVWSGDGSARVAMYRALLRIWGQSTGNSALAQSLLLLDEMADSATGQMSPQARQAFLLTNLEGFCRFEVSQILEISEDEVQDLLAYASSQISELSSSNILIIEDEPFIAAQLKTIVRGLGHWAQGPARTRGEAREAILNFRPDLILSDIQLADDISGIEVVSEFLRESTVPVIFITAYPERLLTGQRLEPTYLVSKPFTKEKIQAIICQALFFHQQRPPQASQRS